MKIMLISSNVTTSPYPIYPIGLGMISAALANAGHEVLQTDFLFNEISHKRLQIHPFLVNILEFPVEIIVMYRSIYVLCIHILLKNSNFTVLKLERGYRA